MVHYARPTFGNHARAASWTTATACGEWLTALVIYYRVLQAVPSKLDAIRLDLTFELDQKGIS
jgi:hypothetical protein